MSWDIFPKSKIQYFLEKLKTKLDLKVDKETGKGLSTNDFDNTYKSKVDKIDTTTTSASGNPISITGLKSDQLAIDPVLTFEPIQDLHGQSKPYPAGGGKNLLPPILNNDQSSISFNDVVLTIQDQSFKFNGTAGAVGGRTALRTKDFTLKAGTYILSMTNGSGLNAFVQNGGTVIGYLNTEFTLSVDTAVNVGFNISSVGTQFTNQIVKVQLESSSSATSYAPYENICPISGYDKVEVQSCGKNLVESVLVGYGLNSSGNVNINAAADAHLAKVYKNSTYTISNNGSTDEVYFSFFYTKPTGVQASYDGVRYGKLSQFTAPIDGYVALATLTGVAKEQLELGSTATTYEPYKSATSISESLEQTVYGAIWYPRTGEFVVDRAIADMGDYTWSYSSNGNFFYVSPTGIKGGGALVCSQYNNLLPTSGELSNNIIGVTSGGQVRCRDTSYGTDASAFKTGMSGVQLVYMLATPIEIQLTPRELTLLKTYAYVSTNCNNIQLSYHNGEMASLGDVSQLGETVNELGEYLQRDATIGDMVDLTSYTASSNRYTFPSDGYIFINGRSNTSGYIRVYVYGKSSSTVNAGIGMNITAIQSIQSLFVKKGMSCYVSTELSASSIIVGFNPIK